MPDFTVTVDFEVYCATCGAGLCNQSSTEERSSRLRVNVEVCERCKERERDVSYEEGYSKGLKDGRREG